MRVTAASWLSWLILPIACVSACGDDSPGGGGGSGGGDGDGGGGGDSIFPLVCDPLVPSYCGFPFPSNAFTVEDTTTVTGLRVAFRTEGLPVSDAGITQDPARWARSDGFSAGGTLLTHFPGAVADGLTSVFELESSLDTDALTVLIDAETLERIPHWSEIDRATPDDEERALLIHPAIPLRDGQRYLVAIRGVADADGAAIDPSPAFVALRDGGDSDEPSVSARRALYEDIFGLLDEAGVERGDLQLAWDFTTASRESNTQWLVHMRDEALELVGESGPEYSIVSVDSDLDPANILYRIVGTMRVPLYLDQVEPGSTLVFGDDGLPEPNADTPMYEVEWELLIPNVAQTQPVPLLQYGHGLLSSYEQVEQSQFRTFANEYGYAIFSTNTIGLAGEEDYNWIATQLVAGEVDELTKMFDRLHQGMLNNLLAMTTMSRGFVDDPTYGQYLDGSKRHYWGVSQGAIQGGVYMALSTDVERAVLDSGGQPYGVLLHRSVDFDPFFVVLDLGFPDSRAQQHIVGLVQMLWDRVEPQAYTKYIFADPFAGTPPARRVLVTGAIGDHEVPTFGNHIMARAMAAKHLDTGARDVFGLEQVSASSIDEDGAVYAEYDFGLPSEPDCNLPMSACIDPHGAPGILPEGREQIDVFFKTGVAANTCQQGVCAFPELGACTGKEDPDPCDD